MEASAGASSAAPIGGPPIRKGPRMASTAAPRDCPQLRPRSAATRVRTLLESVLGPDLRLGVRGWDGSYAGPADPPALIAVRSALALRRLVWSPNELGLARAYVAGDMDVEGDLYSALQFLETRDAARRLENRSAAHRLFVSASAVAALRGIGPPLGPPAEEAKGRGLRHSRRRDAEAIRHHYDVGNDFYRLVLGPSMTYSCAFWPPGTVTLEDAQDAKFELISRKLDLVPGMRLLDVGCGWGSFATYAARAHGVDVVGVTISPAQAELARSRAAAAGVGDRVEIRLQDYRDIADGPYDAVASIGMSEHVGRSQLSIYAGRLAALLAPQGRLLNSAISRPGRVSGRSGKTFISRYVFPDGELHSVARMIEELETAGLEVRDVQSLREHYQRTLLCWERNLEERWEQAAALVGLPRARIWRLYMTASAVAFGAGRIGVDQVLAVRTAGGVAGMPASRRHFVLPAREQPGLRPGPQQAVE